MSTRASQKFGKYSVVYRLGAGGMAEVFKCRLSGIGGFNKLVVVKRIRPELVHEPGFVEMFLDEARIAANLQHPNVVQLFEIDQAQGLPYIAMEYVRGPTLALMNREQRKQRRENKGVVARLMAGICDALHYAHRATDERGTPLNIVHRDVSPQNIIVSMEGVPKLLDFGVAKARGQLAHTTAGAIKGKLKFMAPEQFIPGARLTHAVDTFAAGVCLYEATTLELPYPGENEVEVMRSAAAGKFARPSELRPDFDKRLEEIIMWAMAPNPIDRCPDALALQLALEDYAERERCTQADVAAFLGEVFPDAGGDTPPPGAYVDVESHDILGPPDSVVRHTLPLRSRSSASKVSKLSKVVATPHAAATVDEDVEVELDFDERPAPRRRESRAPVWGAVFTVALIAVFALGVALSRPSPSGAEKAARGQVEVVMVPTHEISPREGKSNGPPPVVAALEPADPELDAAQVARQVASESLDDEARSGSVQSESESAVAREREREKPAPIPRVSAPRQQVTKGWLSIETDPLAQLFVNGRPLGWAPLERLQLSPGTYRVRAQHGKRAPVERDVRILLGRETSVSLTLPELPKTVAVAAPAPAPAPAPEPAREVEEPRSAPPAQAAEPEPAPAPAARKPLAAVAPVAAAAPVMAPPAAVAHAGGAVQVECTDGGKLVRGSSLEAWCEVDGERDGPYLRLWPNGRRAVEGAFRRGKKTGRWLEYYEGGGERARVEWRRGVQLW
ncbi:MAG: serine/threonine protein kinase [Archangiaceae bacterium]|nr:serine/threonine protein kinase [Archangiaceae bacterium]